MKDTLYDNMPQLFMDAPKIGKDPSSNLSWSIRGIFILEMASHLVKG